MELIHYVAVYYLVMVVSVLIAIAIKDRNAELRLALWIALPWPITSLIGVLIFVLDIIKWDFDIGGTNRLFGFRRPADGQPGFAIALLKLEFLFWKRRSS